jgi:6-pyruvoyltetrahydropterin/6-carboxytetrahydropterin synthase
VGCRPTIRAPGCTVTATKLSHLRSPTLDAVGFVRDYHELSALKFINATLDHKHLNDVFGPTGHRQEISKWLYD